MLSHWIYWADKIGQHTYLSYLRILRVNLRRQIVLRERIGNQKLLLRLLLDQQPKIRHKFKWINTTTLLSAFIIHFDFLFFKTRRTFVEKRHYDSYSNWIELWWKEISERPLSWKWNKLFQFSFYVSLIYYSTFCLKNNPEL